MASDFVREILLQKRVEEAEKKLTSVEAEVDRLKERLRVAQAVIDMSLDNERVENRRLARLFYVLSALTSIILILSMINIIV